MTCYCEVSTQKTLTSGTTVVGYAWLEDDEPQVRLSVPLSVIVGGADLGSGPRVLEGEKSEIGEDIDKSEIGEDKGAP